MNPFFNPKVLDEFKASINYPKLKAGLQKQPPIFINWHKPFEQLTVQGQQWVRVKDTNPSIINSHHAMLSTSYANEEKYISVKVHVFSPGYEQSILDYMLTLMASTSMPKVPYSLVANGPGELYFSAPQLAHANADGASYSLLHNMILAIDTADMDLNIRGFAEEYTNTILRIAHSQAQSQPQIKPIQLSANSPQSKYKIGDLITIQYRSNQLDSIQVSVDETSIKGNIEIKEKARDHLTIIPLTSADCSIMLRYVDNQTLYSNEFEVPLSITP